MYSWDDTGSKVYLKFNGERTGHYYEATNGIGKGYDTGGNEIANGLLGNVKKSLRDKHKESITKPSN
jgi:hypothetical protein